MTTRPTNAALVAAAGRALFGDNWQQPLARALGWPLDDKGQNRTIQRIKAAGEAGQEYRINDGVLRDIVDLLTSRSEECAQLARAILDARSQSQGNA